MNYDALFVAKLDALRQAGQYRTFTSLKRCAGRFPYAVHETPTRASEVVIWCTNDYLGMSQHPAVLEATHRAIDAVGIGSGGSRNISGTSPYHEELERELADGSVKNLGRYAASWIAGWPKRPSSTAALT